MHPAITHGFAALGRLGNLDIASSESEHLT
jgi:hypothetical protein